MLTNICSCRGTKPQLFCKYGILKGLINVNRWECLLCKMFVRQGRLYNSKFYVVRFAASKRCENTTSSASTPPPPRPRSQTASLMTSYSLCRTSLLKIALRPFGVAILFAGLDDNGPQLYHMDPSGTYLQFDAKAIGSGSEGAQQSLQEV